MAADKVIGTEAKSLEMQVVFKLRDLYEKYSICISRLAWFSNITHTFIAKSVGCLLNMKL